MKPGDTVAVFHLVYFCTCYFKCISAFTVDALLWVQGGYDNAESDVSRMLYTSWPENFNSDWAVVTKVNFPLILLMDISENSHVNETTIYEVNKSNEEICFKKCHSFWQWKNGSSHNALQFPDSTEKDF